MNHPCARCGNDTPEENLLWLDREDDFVYKRCHDRSKEAERRAVVKKDTIARTLARHKEINTGLATL